MWSRFDRTLTCPLEERRFRETVRLQWKQRRRDLSNSRETGNDIPGCSFACKPISRYDFGSRIYFRFEQPGPRDSDADDTARAAGESSSAIGYYERSLAEDPYSSPQGVSPPCGTAVKGRPPRRVPDALPRCMDNCLRAPERAKAVELMEKFRAEQ